MHAGEMKGKWIIGAFHSSFLLPTFESLFFGAIRRRLSCRKKICTDMTVRKGAVIKVLGPVAEKDLGQTLA